MLLDYIKIQMVQIYEEVIMPTRVESVKRLYDFFIMWDSHQTEWHIFFPNKRKVSQESAFNVAFSSLSAQSDRWIMHLWQKGKDDLNGWWWPHSCYHVMSSQLQNRRGANWTGVTKKSMLFQKSITIRYWDCHQDFLNLPDWMRYFQSTPSPSVDSLMLYGIR